jgi:AraC-like DNA-binding protein
LVCNTEGIAIHHRGDEARAQEFRERGIWVGGVWSEQTEGTNGIGTCIAEQRPVLVHLEQHFRTRHTDLSCATAPIFDPNGKLALVLDASTPRPGPVPSLTLAATKVAARGVEERLFREFFGNVWTIAAAPSDDSHEALLLAVDSDLRVVGADRAARVIFGLDDHRLNDGVFLSGLFEFPKSAFRCAQEQDVAARFTGANAAEWHALITPPLCGSRSAHSPAEVAIHSRPRISMLHDLPLPDPTPEIRGGLPPVRSQQICEYIASNLDQNISLETLAKMAGLSVHHFARVFKQSIGIPPHCYILQRRIERARHLLLNTKRPLSEIALSAGFSDQSHLARHFRRTTGLSPSAMRWSQR